MSIDHFFDSLPKTFSSLILHLNKLGFRVGIIGGTPRDYLLKGVIGKDFDCELRPIEECNLNELWQNLFNSLGEKYSVQKLAYEVIRVTDQNWQVELTYPRVESYNGESGHSNFTAKYVRDQQYQLGFKRRDFTINAILFEKYFDEQIQIDPLKGIDHLEQKILVPCSEDFTQDPVRFLRALRFKTNLSFDYSDELKVMMKSQSLKSLSSHYLLSEINKCYDPMLMFVELCEKRGDFIFQAQQFVAFKDQLLTLFQYTQGAIDGLIQAICWSYKIDYEVRKKLISSLGLSLKKYPVMLEHDFSKLVLNRDRRVDELIKDDEFIHFSKWLSQAFKWELSDDFFVSIFNSFKLKNFTIVQFKAMQRQDIQITSQDKAYYTPSQLKYVVMAKKYFSVSSKDKV